MKRLLKRIFDVSISLLTIILLLPVFVVIAIAIKISNRGPVVFKQERAGKDCKPFSLYKFRTMKVGVEPFGQSPKSGEDPRLIKIGKFLREYSLDELPQLFNVLRGDMSIVGPRPLYISQICELNNYHKKRLVVKPGVTGLSQLYGRSELTSKNSLDLEAEYVEKQSSWLDIKIIFLTFGIVIAKKGVYEK
ncbi:MAG: sugar transferase [Planctomycetota bacterium]|jgi:lipopolysaccharide/colanic/teichoic acid biosynthesis glycosyltransferase